MVKFVQRNIDLNHIIAFMFYVILDDQIKNTAVDGGVLVAAFADIIQQCFHKFGIFLFQEAAQVICAGRWTNIGRAGAGDRLFDVPWWPFRSQ